MYSCVEMDASLAGGIGAGLSGKFDRVDCLVLHTASSDGDGRELAA